MSEQDPFGSLTEKDIEILTRLKPLFQTHAAKISQKCFTHIATLKGTTNIFSSPEAKKSLQQAFSQRLKNLVGGHYDDTYFKDLIPFVQQMENECQLESVLWLSTYTILQHDLFQLVSEYYGAQPNLAQQAIMILARVMALHQQWFARNPLSGAERSKVEETFTSTIIHDLSTPLLIISARAELALRRLPPEHEASQYLTIIIEQTLQISHLIRRLAEFSGLKSKILRNDHEKIVEDRTSE